MVYVETYLADALVAVLFEPVLVPKVPAGPELMADRLHANVPAVQRQCRPVRRDGRLFLILCISTEFA